MEPRADCAACPLTPERSGGRLAQPWAFHPDARCCTFNPHLPNFLAGGALGRGGDAERVVRTRLADPIGVHPEGIFAPPSYRERYVNGGPMLFGHDVSMRCPYWVGGAFACGVWQERPHPCRSWHCRHEHGEPTRLWWRGISKALAAVEDAISRYCVAQAEPPPPGAPVEAWVRWYLDCAERVAALTPEALDVIREEKVQRARQAIAAGRPPVPPLPDLVVACLRGMERDGDVVWILGYSSYDVLRLPPTVFVFLSKLDGHTTWQDALAAANAELEAPLPDGMVRDLFRIGAIRHPEAGDVRGDDAPGYDALGDGVSMRLVTT